MQTDKTDATRYVFFDYAVLDTTSNSLNVVVGPWQCKFCAFFLILSSYLIYYDFPLVTKEGVRIDPSGVMSMDWWN